MKWGGNLTRMAQKKIYRNLVGRPKEKSPLKNFGVDERKMLRFPYHAIFYNNSQNLCNIEIFFTYLILDLNLIFIKLSVLFLSCALLTAK